MSEKSNVLLVGSGGVGTMGAYNLEIGGLATVTAVLRSNYEAVKNDGFNLTSMDHGDIKGWRPTTRTIPIHFAELSLICSSPQNYSRRSEGRNQTIRLHLRRHEEHCRRASYSG
jgi:ketopantoate reductase